MPDYDYDPDRGLILPKDFGRYQAGPNPTSAPPIDPAWQRRLDEIGRSIGRRLQWYWMREVGCWGIQQHGPRGWQTVFMNYDERGQWQGNMYPYRPIDDRALKEFCEACLQIRYGTGDFDKDAQMRDREITERQQREKDRRDKRSGQLIEAVISGGDPKRFGRLLRHEEMHNGPGVRFQEYFPGADLGGGE